MPVGTRQGVVPNVALGPMVSKSARSAPPRPRRRRDSYVRPARPTYVRPATVSPLEQQTSKNLPSFSRIALPPASASMSTSSKPESASGDRCSSEPGSTRRSSDASRPRKASGPINVRRGLSERSSEIRVTSSKAGTVARSRPAQSAARPPATSEHAQTSQIAPLFVGSRDQ